MDAVSESKTEDVSMDAYLASGEFVDSQSQEVVAFTEKAIEGAQSPKDKAIALYYAVRDEIRYDPYVAIADKKNYKASNCIRDGRGFCIAKAAVLAACARAAGIPSRVAYADVRNHLSTPRLRKIMGGSDIFANHGYTELFLDGRWIKVTPTFNLELCEKFEVFALDFDGVNDALLHPYDKKGRRHMEYTDYAGSFQDVPADMLTKAMLDNYGAEVCENLARLGGDFEREAEADAAG